MKNKNKKLGEEYSVMMHFFVIVVSIVVLSVEAVASSVFENAV